MNDKQQKNKLYLTYIIILIPFIIFLFLFIYRIALSSTLDQNYNWDNGDNEFAIGLNAGSEYEYAQSFTPSVTGQIDKFCFDLAKKSVSAGTIWVEIWSDSGNEPNAQIESDSTSIDVSTLPADYTDEAFTCFTWSSNYPDISASTLYWAVLQRSETSWYVGVNGDVSSPSYANGSAGRYTNDVWALQTGWDLVFEQYYYSEGTPTPTPTPTASTTYSTATSTDIIAFGFIGLNLLISFSLGLGLVLLLYKWT